MVWVVLLGIVALCSVCVFVGIRLCDLSDTNTIATTAIPAVMTFMMNWDARCPAGHRHRHRRVFIVHWQLSVSIDTTMAY